MIIKREKFLLLANTGALAFSKGIDMVTQLLVMPRLIYLYGIEKYGSIAFYVVIMQYLLTLCDFGYNYNATRRVVGSNNKDIANHIYTAVLLGKILIAFIIILVLSFIYIFSGTLSLLIYASLAVYVVFSIFNVDWLYLGKQNMIPPTIAKLICRVVYLLTLFFVFDNTFNYEYVIAMDGLVPMCIVVPNVLYAKIKYNVKLKHVESHFVKELFHESWVLFSSSLFIIFYRNINIIVLKLLAGEYYAGVYAAVEKITRACQAIIEPVTTALYPYIGKISSDKVKIMVFNKISKVYIIILFALAIIIVMCGQCAIKFFNIEGDNALINFYVMVVPFFFGCLNYLFGYTGLVNFNREKRFRISVFKIGIFSIPCSFIFSYNYYNIGAALTVAISEFLLFILLLVEVKKINIDL